MHALRFAGARAARVLLGDARVSQPPCAGRQGHRFATRPTSGAPAARPSSQSTVLTAAAAPNAAVPAPLPREPTGFRRKTGTEPQVLVDYRAEHGTAATGARDENGLLFPDKLLHGLVKYGIWALSACLGAYAVFEMPVSRSPPPPVTVGGCPADCKRGFQCL